MDKEDVVYTYNGILLSHKKDWNFAICSNMNGLGGHSTKWNKQRKINTVWYHLYVESKKYNKLVNIINKKQTHRYREQNNGYQRGEGKGEEQYRSREVRGTNY